MKNEFLTRKIPGWEERWKLIPIQLGGNDICRWLPSACEVQCRSNGGETPIQMDKDDFPILSTPTACSQIHLLFLCIDHQCFSALIIIICIQQLLQLSPW